MKVYCITDGNGTTARILPEKGATVVSFCKDGTEYLYSDPENLESTERPRCGIPFLFPIFGRLKQGKYIWQQHEYAMEIHGFAHTSEWTVQTQTPDSLTLVLEANEQTLAQYPFRFRVTLTFCVENGSLTIRQKYENLGAQPMPYNYGFHPYFLTEQLQDLQVEANADTLFYFTAGAAPFGHGKIGLSVPDGAPETGAALMGARSPTVLHNKTTGKSLTMEFDESFHTHVLWAPAGAEFLCVEPINGSADGLNTGNYMLLAPGQCKEAVVRFTADTN